MARDQAAEDRRIICERAYPGAAVALRGSSLAEARHERDEALAALRRLVAAVNEKIGPACSSAMEAIQESILLRGLVRAGVLGHANCNRFFDLIGGSKGLYTEPLTPIAALLVLANAHLDAEERADRLDRQFPHRLKGEDRMSTAEEVAARPWCAIWDYARAWYDGARSERAPPVGCSTGASGTSSPRVQGGLT